MSGVLYTVGGFLVALGVLIVVHELGHYLVARWAGVKVLRFSVGFGRPLLTRRIGRDATEWSIAAIPLGGYVRMLDEREGAVAAHERHRAFDRQSVWKRIAIVCAGPAANLLLAIVLYAGIYVGGVEGLRAVLSAPGPDTPAARAGILGGDEILAVDGEALASWQELRWRLLRRSGAPSARLEVRRETGERAIRELDLAGLTAQDWESDFLPRLGLAPWRPALEPVVGTVSPGSPAERSGLRPGDRIASIDGEAVRGWDDVVEKIAARAEREVELGIVRGERAGTVVARTEAAERAGRRIGRLGIGPRVPEGAYDALRVTVRQGPLEALGTGARKVWELSEFSLRMLWRILTGEASARNISGPITMAGYAGQSAEQGLTVYVGYLALISVSLGVINLLPVPLLDGGHLLYYLAELIKGSPVSDRAMELGQRVGMAVLVLLMGLAFYNDLARLLGS